MKKLFLFAILAGFLQFAYAQPGQLDSSFGNNGISISNLGDSGVAVIASSGR